MPQNSPPTRIQRWVSGPLKSLRVRGALLRFGFTRSKILEVRVLHAGGPLNFDFVSRVNLAAAWAQEEISFSGGSPLTLEVRYQGESLDLLRVTWFRSGPVELDRDEVLLEPEWLEELEDSIAEPLRQVLRLETVTEEADEGLTDRDDVRSGMFDRARVSEGDLLGDLNEAGCGAVPPDLILHGEGTPDEKKAAASLFEQRRAAIHLRSQIECFFLTFDIQSDRALTRSRAVDNLSILLTRRVTERREAGRRGLKLRPATMGAGALAHLRTVRDWFEASMESSGLEEKHLGFAFELFVSGRLSAVHPDPTRREELKTHGTTNSEMYFLFPELALACARHPESEHFSNADRLKWSSRAGHLVRAAHLLTTFRWDDVRAAPGHGEAPSVVPYRYFDGLSMSMQRIESFRSAYASAAEEWGLDGEESADEACDIWEDIYGQVLALGEERVESPAGGEALEHTLPKVLVPPLLALRVPRRADIV